MVDPSLQVALCGAIETLINKALQFDPGTRYALGRLPGKVLAVELTQPQLTFYIFPETEGVRIQSVYDGDVTTRLKGSPLALLALVNSNQVNLADSGIEVFGNTGFLIELQGLLQQLDIDWEEAISTIIGDIAGHQVGNTVNGLKQWLGERKQSFERLLGEFLTEEVRATPGRAELDYFYQQVDELRLGVDRITAKVQQFTSQHSSTSATDNTQSTGDSPPIDNPSPNKDTN